MNLRDIMMAKTLCTGGSGVTVQADWEQKNSYASDYIKNKPFYEKGVAPIAWDGNIEGKETLYFLPFDQHYVKLSDTWVASKDIIGTTATGGNKDNPNIFSGELTEDTIVYFNESPFNIIGIKDPNTYGAIINVGWGQTRFVGIMVASDEEIYLTDEVVMMVTGMSQEDLESMSESQKELLETYRNISLTKGMYFMYNPVSQEDLTPYQWVTSVSFPENLNYQLKQLDEKFIPDTIARLDDIPTEASEYEFIEFLNDISIVEPLASASGEIYTTNNDELYIL